jgi:septal ring factor EnvC (AmiA/AmiB activator)
VVDMANDVLKQLDERIQASVTRIQQLQRENEQLARQLAESEHRYHETAAQLKEHDAARTEVKGRLEKILARFDGLDLG